jgi:hypothetical protein
LADAGIRVSVDAAEALASQCGGHPYYVIKLLGMLARKLDDNRCQWHVTRKDANGAVEDFLADHDLLSTWALECARKPADQLCLDGVVQAGEYPSQYVSAAQVAKRTGLEADQVGALMARASSYQVLERSQDSPFAYRLAFPLMWTWIRRGGLRRDFFDQVDAGMRHCLYTLAEPANRRRWLPIGQILPSGVDDEQAAATLHALVDEGVIGSQRGRYRLQSAALRMWIGERRSSAAA